MKKSIPLGYSILHNQSWSRNLIVLPSPYQMSLNSPKTWIRHILAQIIPNMLHMLYGDPEPGSVTPGHVHQGKCFWEQQAKDPIEKYRTVLSVHSIIWVHIFPRLSQNSWNPIAANANSVIFLNGAFLFGKRVCEWTLDHFSLLQQSARRWANDPT